MIINDVNTNDEVFVIAEIGNNHEGSLSLAKEMIHGVASTGAHAVKFQTFKTEHYVSRENPDRFKTLQSFELTHDEFRELAELARSLSLIFLSTPFDLYSAKFLDELVPAYKIGSGENSFYPLLECVARTGKPVILSTGLADIEQIRRSVNFITQIWAEGGTNPGLAVLHCVTSYPVADEDLNLSAITALKSELSATIGYSDHALGIEPAIIAVALGARIIEKHFTLDKNMSDFRDHKISSTPEELTELVDRIKQLSTWLGDGNPAPRNCEEKVSQLIRRSIVSSAPLTSGTVLSEEHLSWTRPSGGLAPGEEHLVVGKKLMRDLEAGDRIRLEDLA